MANLYLNNIKPLNQFKFGDYYSKTDAYLKDIKDNNHPFSIEERKWAAEAVADCYKRIENGTAKRMKSKA